MFNLSYPFGSGTKEDPFRVPYVKNGKDHLFKVPLAKAVLKSTHGEDDSTLFLFSGGSQEYISYGGQVSTPTDRGVEIEFPFYSRDKNPSKLDMFLTRAIKFGSRVNGKFNNSMRLTDPAFQTGNWGEGNYYCTTMGLEEYEKYVESLVVEPDVIVEEGAVAIIEVDPPELEEEEGDYDEVIVILDNLTREFEDLTGTLRRMK